MISLARSGASVSGRASASATQPAAASSLSTSISRLSLEIVSMAATPRNGLDSKTRSTMVADICGVTR